jgi:protein-L-isoaspartate O-methyltransferase
MSGKRNPLANPLTGPLAGPLAGPSTVPLAPSPLPLGPLHHAVSRPASDLSLLGNATEFADLAPSRRPTGQPGGTSPGTRPPPPTDQSLPLRPGGHFHVCTRPHHGELMSTLLGALDPRPGQTVLRIGTVPGADRQSQLLSWLVGAFGSVTSVEPSSWPTAPPAVCEPAPPGPGLAGRGQTTVAPEADAALGPETLARAPYQGRHDRILVTRAVAALPAAWAGGLAPGGRLVAPIEHGGVGRLITVTPADDAGGFVGQGVDWCAFLPIRTSADPAAENPPRPPASLPTAPWPTAPWPTAPWPTAPWPTAPWPTAPSPTAPSPTAPSPTGPSPTTPWPTTPWPTTPWQTVPCERDPILPDLDDDDYRSLWFAMACLDKRVTLVPGDLGGPEGFGLVDPLLGTIGVHRDRLRLAGEDQLVVQASKWLHVWESLGRPSPDRWSCSLNHRGSLLLPGEWSCYIPFT